MNITNEQLNGRIGDVQEEMRREFDKLTEVLNEKMGLIQRTLMRIEAKLDKPVK